MSGVRKFSKIAMNLDTWTVAYVSGMITKPSSAHIQLIDKFVKTTKSILSNKADVFYFGNINNSNDSFRNLVKNSHHGTIQGSGLVWDNLVGFTNPNGTGWVDTNYNPATQGIKYTLNDAGIGVNAFSCPNIIPEVAWLLSCFQSTAIRSQIVFNSLSTYVNGSINDGTNNSLIGNPFLNGFHHIRRDSSTTKTFVNQNKANGSFMVTSGSIPNSNFELFRQNGSVPQAYKFGLNVTYIGASLTDAEYATLNTAINEYLIGCLFLKYGADNWGVKMAKSYFYDLHGFEKYEAFEVYEFIKRHQSDYVDNTTTGYYYNTFSPIGLNKTIADYIMLFKAGGNLVANAWSKTGALLRWNQDRTVTTSNTMPAYTRGSNLGIVTVTSTDGWNELTLMVMAQTANSVNSYYGNTPLVNKIRIGASKVITVQPYNGKMKTNVIGNTNAFNGLYCINTSYPGYCKITVQDMIGKSWYTLGTFGNLPINPIVTSRLIGCVTELTTEFAGPSSINMVTSNELYGSLKNVVHQNTCSGGYYFYDTNIVEGFSSWSKIIPILHFGNCKLPTDAVNAQLKVINDYFAVNTPIKSVTINLSGASMGIPTGGANNADLLGIIAKHVAAGFTATISVRTS